MTARWQSLQLIFGNATLPDGQIDLRKSEENRICPALARKIFLFYFSEKYGLLCAVPPSMRGALRDRHECWKRDAMDAIGSQDVRCRSVTQKRVVLTPLGWC
jgi:hypothetical protein